MVQLLSLIDELLEQWKMEDIAIDRSVVGRLRLHCVLYVYV